MQETQIEWGKKSMSPIIPKVIVPQPLKNFQNCIFRVEPDKQLEFYKNENSRLLKENRKLIYQLNKVKEAKQEFQQKFNDFKLKQKEIEKESDEKDSKKKRLRRNANQIVRQFTCPKDRCGKSYGTEASLIQHIKLKHEEIYENKEYKTHIDTVRKRSVNNFQSNVIQSQKNQQQQP